MSVPQPEPFDLTFSGPTGRYRLGFRPDVDEGHFEVTLGEVSTVWHVDVCEREGDGWRLAGLTRDTVGAWGDTYWYSLGTGPTPRIQYWGDQVLIREDQADLPDRADVV
jgi:hypothetical protein